MKQSAGGHRWLHSELETLLLTSFAAASLSKSASEKLDHFCSEFGRSLPAVAAAGPGFAVGGEEFLGRRRSAQVAESTFPRKVNLNVQRRSSHMGCPLHASILNACALGQEGWAVYEEAEGR